MVLFELFDQKEADRFDTYRAEFVRLKDNWKVLMRMPADD